MKNYLRRIAHGPSVYEIYYGHEGWTVLQYLLPEGKYVSLSSFGQDEEKAKDLFRILTQNFEVSNETA